MSQLSYSLNQGVAISGGVADTNPVTVHTYNNPDSPIKFGRMVARKFNVDTACKLPDAPDSVMVGVALRDLAREEGDYPTKSAVAVLKRGRVFAEVEEAVTPDDRVFIRFANGPGGTEKGIFRKNDDGNTAVEVAAARFLTSAGIGGIAEVDLNLT